MPDEKPLIAIVDDDDPMLEATGSLVRSLGYAVEAFSSAKAFLDSPRLGHAACLIADVNMPEMTGLELQHHLVRLGRRIPTILFTAYPNERVRSEAFSAGVKFYLAKPFGEEELLKCIRSCLDNRGETQP